jgi:hypothetical protein
MFPTPVNITGYRIYPYSSASGTLGFPKAWAFEGSNDGLEWKELNAQEGQFLEKGRWYKYSFDNVESYQYYRLKITEAQNPARLDIGELEFCSVYENNLNFDIAGFAASDLSGISISEDVVLGANLEADDSMTLSADLDLRGIASTIKGVIDLAGYTLSVDSLSGGGTIKDSSAFDKTSKQTDDTYVKSYINGVAKAFDQAAWHAFGDFSSYSSSGNPQHRVMTTSFSPPVDIDYDFVTPTVIDSFRLTSGNNNSANLRSPKSMSFLGWDGENWVSLGSWKSEMEWSKNETRQYDFANQNAYSKYRIRIDENNGAVGIVEFFKLEYACRAEAGKVVIDISDGSTAENTDVTLIGNTRLVKIGGGTFIASKGGQSYTGGTELREGTIKCGSAESDLFGRQRCEVMVMKDGVFEPTANKGNIGKYHFTFYGGMLSDSGTDISDGSDYQRIVRMSLKNNSSFDAENSMYIGSETSSVNSHVDLGGNVFSGTIGDGKFLRLDRLTIENGTLEVTNGDGYLLARNTVNAQSVDFRLNCAIVVASESLFSVRNYEALGGTRSTSKQTGSMLVYGIFTPVSDSFYGCTLMNGSTIDLSKRTTALNVHSDFTAGAKTLKFDENATVKIKLGTQYFPQSKILSWTKETKPANVDTVQFVKGDSDRRYSLVVREDGLYADVGLIITIH